jgi:hypothetical protein
MRRAAWALVAVLVINGLIGPLGELATLPEGALVDADWWARVAEEAVRGLATGALSGIAVVAAALGIEVRDLQRRAEREEQV